MSCEESESRCNRDEDNPVSGTGQAVAISCEIYEEIVEIASPPDSTSSLGGRTRLIGMVSQRQVGCEVIYYVRISICWFKFQLL